MIALTGSTGFLGRGIILASVARDDEMLPLIRSTDDSSRSQIDFASSRAIGELGTAPIVPTVLAGCTAVIHAAARAHRMGERGNTALAAYRRTNVDGTHAVIAAMAAARVRRLVYVSSIKAIGERSHARPLHPGDQRHPEDPYGISKSEAEDVVLTAHAAGAIEAVIIRPVLVHGPGAKGNLARLLAAIHGRRMLPLGAVRNRRSMVGLANLADALLTAATAPMPPLTRPPVYHIADDGVISTRRLVEVLAEGMGIAPRLISLPRWLTVGCASLLGKGTAARRLFDDLEVDDQDFRRDFNWKPLVGLEDGLRLMARDYASRHGGTPPASG